MNEHTRQLHDLGQRLWLDNISRSLLRSGTLQRYIDEYAITGLTSNPTVFEQAFGGDAYDDSIRVLHAAGLAGEELFFACAESAGSGKGRYAWLRRTSVRWRTV